MKKKLLVAGGIIVLLGIAFLSSLLFFGRALSPQGYEYGGVSSSSSYEIPRNFSLPSSQKTAVSPMAEDSAGTNSYTNNTSETGTDKKVIKNGNLNLKVDNADEASQEINQIAKDNGGEVFSSSFYQSGKNTKSGSIIVKVPVANFEKAFSELKKVASLVIQESTSGQDVTEQYADLQAQLKNKQAEEEAFVRIMAQAQKIDDILAVQKELSRVRGQIEQLQGRIKYMDSQTDMATISISLSEDTNISIVDKWRPWQVVKESASVLIKKVQNFVDFLIRLVILVIPVAIIYGILFWIIYKIGRKVYFKFKKKEQV